VSFDAWSAVPDGREWAFQIDLQPRHAEAVLGTVDFPQEEHDAQGKGNEETGDGQTGKPGEIQDERDQQDRKDAGHHRSDFIKGAGFMRGKSGHVLELPQGLG
jgi:hypothetical protein